MCSQQMDGLTTVFMSLCRALSGNDTASQLIATALQQQGLLPQQLSGLGSAFNHALQEQAWQVPFLYFTSMCGTQERRAP